MKVLRSILFVPGDSEKKLAKGPVSGADALMLDLEDAVAPSRKQAARGLVRAFLDAHPDRSSQALWVRINAFDHPDALSDLAAVVGGRPDGIMLPKANSPQDVLRLGHCLDALEAREGIAPGQIQILPLAAETAVAPFTLGDYAKVDLPRLMGLTWGPEDLSAELGATTNRVEGGDWDFPYRVVRSLVLFAAHAAGVEAVEIIHPDYRDAAGLRASSLEARRQGFTGRLAIHPDQVAIINESFSPTPEDIAEAERVVAAFEAAPQSGAIGIGGKMYDRPHLKRARRVLALRDAHR